MTDRARPLAIDLFCGLGGWTDGLIATGYEVVGFDIERHAYGGHRYPAQLVLQDVTMLHGAQFRDAALIVASPPCQEYSYMAMPWTRAKQIAAALRGEGDFPDGYTGSRTVAELTALFDACFRIQREASAMAGRHVPMVVENVKGAQPWVGRGRGHYGSYYLWGDVPALMPIARAVKVPTMGAGWYPPCHPKHVPGLGFNTHAGRATKNTGGRKQPGLSGPRWFDEGAAGVSSRSPARKAASALIAKIPLPLSQHIARVFLPDAPGPGRAAA